METEVEVPVQEASPELMHSIFAAQKVKQAEIAVTSSNVRKQKLKRLEKALFRYRNRLREALYADFRKHASEVDLTDIYPVISEIRHTRRHLSNWMSPQYAAPPLTLIGSRSRIHYEPKGVVLIIAPWNFPVNLTLGPLVSAIAAGNCVILKPSELTPHTSGVMSDMITELFDSAEVSLIEGGIKTSQELLKLPFNHIYFTGSPEVGKIVMNAAARNLASVTLELGGKSPVIIDDSANVEHAAKRLAWAKFINNGQACITPDHIFVHEKIKMKFLDRFRHFVDLFYGESAKESESYARIVNSRHYDRLKNYISDPAVQRKIIQGGETETDERFIEPTIIDTPPVESDLMKDEIFGPILPVYTFTDLADPVAMINKGEKPLAIDIYSRNKINIKRIIRETRAGGTCINHSLIHFFNSNLPFGGSNNSGIGKGHGIFGFQEFSNARAVLKQIFPISAVDLLMPPYGKFKQKLIDLTIKWF